MEEYNITRTLPQRQIDTRTETETGTETETRTEIRTNIGIYGHGGIKYYTDTPAQTNRDQYRDRYRDMGRGQH